MGLSCRAWTGSQISLLFGLEGLVQDCFKLYFSFKGLRLNRCPQTGLSQRRPKIPPRAADGHRGAEASPDLPVQAVGLCRRRGGGFKSGGCPWGFPAQLAGCWSRLREAPSPHCLGWDCGCSTFSAAACPGTARCWVQTHLCRSCEVPATSPVCHGVSLEVGCFQIG